MARAVGLPLFVYGTLRDDAVLAAVLARPLEGVRFEPAHLDGHAVLAVRGAPYPGLAARPGALAHGRLILGLQAADWARLDAYEGPGYARRPVSVRALAERAADPGTPAVAAIEAETYLATGLDLLDTPWSFEAWTATGRAGLLASLGRPHAGG